MIIPRIGELWKYDDGIITGYCIISKTAETSYYAEAKVTWVWTSEERYFHNDVFSLRSMNDEMLWNKLA